MTPDAIPDLLAELDALVGLAPVKAGVERLVAIHQLNSVRVTAGEPIIAHDLDLMFTGDPGTGDDQVAALIGRSTLPSDSCRRGRSLRYSEAILLMRPSRRRRLAFWQQ